MSKTSAASTRRGGVYVIVLSISAVTMSMGLIGLTALATQREVGERTLAAAEAGVLAESAIQIALERIELNDNWRSAAGGILLSDTELGRGTIKAWAVDPDDADLADDDSDTASIIGEARIGSVRQRISVDIENSIVPMTILDYGFIIEGGARDQGDGTGHVTVVHRNIPYRAGKGELVSIAFLFSSVTTAWMDLPDPDIVQQYASIGTSIPPSASNLGRGDEYIDLELSTTAAPSGVTPDPNGVYVIDAGGKDIEISSADIRGTLVIINASGRAVTMTKTERLTPGPDGYPVILTDGDLVLDDFVATTVSGPLPDADDDGFADPLYNGSKGIIYVDGDLVFQNGFDLYGICIVTGRAYVNDTIRLMHDPSYANNPPPGFYEAERLHILSGSWRKIVD